MADPMEVVREYIETRRRIPEFHVMGCAAIADAGPCTCDSEYDAALAALTQLESKAGARGIERAAAWLESEAQRFGEQARAIANLADPGRYDAEFRQYEMGRACDYLRSLLPALAAGNGETT